MTSHKIVWSLLLTGAVMSAACGDSKSSMNPSAPSAVAAGSQSAEAGEDGVSTGAAKGGNPGKPQNPGNGNGNGNGKQPTTPGAPQLPGNTSPGSPSAPGLKKVEIEGLITAKGGDSIIVNGQRVVVPSTCPIRHGNTSFTFADLHIGDRVHVRANKVTDDSTGPTATTTLEATEVKFQNPGDASEGNAPTNLVSVAATDAVAAEIGTDGTGTFTLTRSGDAALLASPLTVTFTLTGTAVNGTDYTNVPLSATFAPGVATTTVVVTPLADATTEGAETAILTLGDTTPYEVGSPAFATVTINDTTTPLVSVTPFDSTATEAGDPGAFRFARTGSTAASLTVTYSVGGTATAGADYTALTLSVVIPAGQSFVDVPVTPLPDADATEIAETVIVTVTDGATYDLGATPSATVTIAQ
jgi:hypothetical protein